MFIQDVKTGVAEISFEYEFFFIRDGLIRQLSKTRTVWQVLPAGINVPVSLTCPRKEFLPKLAILPFFASF